MGAYAVPKFPAGGSVTGHASAALTEGRFVSQTTTAPIAGNAVVGVPAAGARVAYVTGETAASGAKVLLHQPWQKVWVEAGATLAPGDLVEASNTGRAVVRASGVVCGECIQGNTVGLPALIDFRPGLAASAPAAPTIGTATAGDGTVTGNWTAPADTGGSAITGYVVTLYAAADDSVVQTATVGAVLTQTFTGVPNDAGYYVKVAAVNAFATGPQSAASNVVTPTA